MSSAIPLRYNWRSLQVRWVTTLLTLGGVALVVATFVALMALAAGLSHAIGSQADPRNAVLLYRGSISEAMSRVTVDQYQNLRFLPQIATDEKGDSLASLESFVQVNLPRRRGGEAMVVMRGMRPVGLKVHDQVRLQQGTWFLPQSSDCVVGTGLAERHPGVAVGKSIRLGRRDLRIVGIFEAGGSALESEIWADLDDVVSGAGRDWYNSVSVRLSSREEFPAFKAAVTGDPRIDLGVKTELDYYKDQAGSAEGFRILGLIVCFFMAIGAGLAEMNTMYAAIGSRTREIGTLRALGFGRGAILISFLAESVFLALPGGLLGCLIGSSFDGFTTSVLSFATVSEVSFQFLVTPEILLSAFAFSLGLGLLGGMAPAVAAARTPVLKALRKV